MIYRVFFDVLPRDIFQCSCRIFRRLSWKVCSSTFYLSWKIVLVPFLVLLENLICAYTGCLEKKVPTVFGLTIERMGTGQTGKLYFAKRKREHNKANIEVFDWLIKNNKNAAFAIIGRFDCLSLDFPVNKRTGKFWKSKNIKLLMST